jgi:hypothetical protein
LISRPPRLGSTLNGCTVVGLIEVNFIKIYRLAALIAILLASQWPNDEPRLIRD